MPKAKSKSIVVRLVEFCGRHPFATGVMAIIGVVSFVISVWGFALDRSESKSTSRQISRVENAVASIEESTKLPELNLVVDGKWNSATAASFALEKLEKFDWPFCEASNCEASARVIGEYSLIYPNFERIVVVASARDPDPAANCHGCSVSLSFFEFEKVPGGWSLYQEDIAAFNWGTWGNLDASDLDVRVIGNGAYGVFVKLGYTMGDERGEVTEVWAKIADTYRQVLRIRTYGWWEHFSEDDTGEYVAELVDDWKISCTPKATQFGIFDLACNLSGITAGEQVDQNFIFQFDGQRYSASDAPDEIHPG